MTRDRESPQEQRGRLGLALFIALGGTGYAASQPPRWERRQQAAAQRRRDASQTRRERDISGSIAMWAQIRSGRTTDRVPAPRPTVNAVWRFHGLERVTWKRSVSSRCFATRERDERRPDYSSGERERVRAL